MEGNLLPDENHVSRYCKPTDFDRKTCRPKVSAFQRRKSVNADSEEYLSVNWLEYYLLKNRRNQIQEVKDSFQRKKYRVRRNGRFVVLNVASVKAATMDVIGAETSILYLPFKVDPSHAAIYGAPEDDLEFATELTLLVSRSDVYPAVN